ncbi:hypothetical protein GCM10009097_38830 [Pigmentiphaga daeguensis]|uniref:Uncharacterized protein n=1 Tax=Pigmentiphaga daeguensis TaxID=414049 RepID=A0ABN1CEK1_9BURK
MMRKGLSGYSAAAGSAAHENTHTESRHIRLAKRVRTVMIGVSGMAVIVRARPLGRNAPRGPAGCEMRADEDGIGIRPGSAPNVLNKRCGHNPFKLMGA